MPSSIDSSTGAAWSTGLSPIRPELTRRLSDTHNEFAEMSENHLA